MAGFEWRKITRRPTLLLLAVVISRVGHLAVSSWLLIRREYAQFLPFTSDAGPMMCLQINGASMAMSSAMPPNSQNTA
jgi:hypothetical protein